MELSKPTFSSNAFSTNALVVSHDPALADQLRGILETDHHRDVETAHSYREAEGILKRQFPQAVFIDFRNAGNREDPSSLLHDLSQRARDRVPVIAVSDRGYVCDWAAVADLIVSGHLYLPLDRQQLSGLLENRSCRNRFEITPCPPSPRVVCSQSVSYRTYSPEMCHLLDNLLTVSSHDVTILLVGETGTGKTTMARMIHELSPRRDSRLLTVGCGALPPELIESELFGHVRGAFTGADRSKIGKFEAAKDGSLLLDEIDVLTPSQQAKLLRVIETHEFEPVGCNETRMSRARVIAASNLDLKHLMERNRFRADLYYRLNMLEFHIPPLRKRPHDIVSLSLEFIDEFCAAHDVDIRSVHPEFLACLKGYCWPGNVRELKNHVRRAVLFCSTGELTPNELAQHLVQAMHDGSSGDGAGGEKKRSPRWASKVFRMGAPA